MKRYDVYAIGNALVDFLLSVEEEYLVRRGIDKGSMTLVTEPADAGLSESEIKRAQKCSGGSAANTIVGLAVLGGRGAYSGKVGRDSLGVFYRQEMRELGIDFFGSGSSERTGTCLSLVTPDGERSMLTYLGASTGLTKDDISEEAITSSTYIYLEGYLWDSESARQASLAAMQMAGKYNTKVAFSFSDSFLVDRFRDDFLQVSRDYCDLLFCNEQEAMMITGTDNVNAAAAELSSLTHQLCITLGPRGALIVQNRQTHYTPALSVEKVVDTTGAGDLYAAGVLRGLTLGLDLVSSSLLGARLAAAVVEIIGARIDKKMLS